MIYLQALIGIAMIAIPFILSRPVKLKADKLEDLFERRVKERS